MHSRDRWLAVVLIVLFLYILFFWIPFGNLTLYQKARIYYGLVLVEQLKSNSQYKLAYSAVDGHKRTPKEQLRVPVDELKLPVISLWIEPKNKQLLDTEYQRIWGKTIHYVGKESLENVYQPQYVDATAEFDGKLYNAKVRLRGDGFWHYIGNPSYRVKLRDNEKILGMPAFNLRRLETIGMISYILGFKVGTLLGTPTPDAQFAHLFVNGKYQGLRTMFENLDGGFLEKHGYDGWIFHETLHTPQEMLYSYQGKGKEEYPYWNIRNSDTKNDGWDAFITILKFINDADNDEFREKIDEHIDIPILLRFATTKVLNGGEYLISHNNTWMLDKETKRMFPITNDTKGYIPVLEVVQRDPYALYNPMLWRIFSLSPEHFGTIDRQLKNILDKELPIADMLSLIDEILSDVRHDVYFKNSDDFEKNIVDIKEGIRKRYEFLEEHLANGNPHLEEENGKILLSVTPSESWTVDGILLKSPVAKVTIEKRHLLPEKRADGTFFRFTHTFIPKWTTYQPSDFDNLGEETPMKLVYILLYRKQLRSETLRLPVDIVTSSSPITLQGEVWSHATDGTQVKIPFSIAVE